eukprot:TRINITY_DN12682_c0_g1_i2.p1 TRINITY_DN12682_c0_g1~~TRINITY_DN12682_c0_g1_i2.p1  ORF type:complete len:181 (+),score=66.04 TRINITY_DN12682_c0_g1_i2:502-1044(+)
MDSTLERSFEIVQVLKVDIAEAQRQRERLAEEMEKVSKEIKEETEAKRQLEAEREKTANAKVSRGEDISVAMREARALEEKLRSQREVIEKERTALCQKIKSLIKGQQTLLSAMCEAKVVHGKEDERLREDICLHKLLAEELVSKRDQARSIRDELDALHREERKKLLAKQRMFLALINH